MFTVISRLAIAALWALVLMGSSFGPAQAVTPVAVEMAGDATMVMVGESADCADSSGAADACGHPCDCAAACGPYLTTALTLDWTPVTAIDLLVLNGPEGAAPDHLKRPPRTTHIG